MDEIKNRLTEMLAWLHNYCVKNNLKYYVIGGTMLGAVRHKGFIPWDDDIDIGMPRKDYEKLLDEYAKEGFCNSAYELESWRDGNLDFQYPFTKLYHTQTLLIENRKMQPRRGIYIDIFPLDGIGNTKELAKKNFNPIKRKLNLLALKSCAIRVGRSKIKNMAIRFMNLIPDCFVNDRHVLKSIDENCASRSFDTYKWVGNLVGNWRDKEIMKRTVFGEPQLYIFEDMKVFGVENPDEYLTNLYGNWRSFPPVEKQISHHDFLQLDLNQSYKL